MKRIKKNASALLYCGEQCMGSDPTGVQQRQTYQGTCSPLMISSGQQAPCSGGRKGPHNFTGLQNF